MHSSDVYPLVKVLHIISATVLFGTGMGIAFVFLGARRGENIPARLFAARLTVRMDFIFTLPAIIVQSLSGWWLIRNGGFDWADRWLVWTYALYLLAGACWIPVVFLQIRMRQMLEEKSTARPFDQRSFDRLFRWWFALGVPAFGGLVIVFWLMVTKPTW
jgi:uncharacterized membrane protein